MKETVEKVRIYMHIIGYVNGENALYTISVKNQFAPRKDVLDLDIFL